MNTSEKNNTGLVVCSTFFIILSILLGGFIIYDKFLDNSNSNNENNNTSNNNTSNENSDIIDENITSNINSYQILELSPIGGHAILFNGEVYVNIYDSTTNIDDIYGKGKYQTLLNTRNNYKHYDFGELTFTTKYIYMGGSSKWLKLNISDVESIHNNEYGQGLSSTNPKYGIIMLNKDNTVSYISINNLIDGNTNVIKLNVSEITNVVTEDNDGYTTYLISNNGSKNDANTYIN